LVVAAGMVFDGGMGLEVQEKMEQRGLESMLEKGVASKIRQRNQDRS